MRPDPQESTIENALVLVNRFVTETTGQSPTPAEIADALGRYFVLKEISEHIEMGRSESVTR